MGQKLGLSKLFSGGQSNSETPVGMMRMMAPTVPVGKQRKIAQKPYGVQPVQQQVIGYR